MCHETVTKTTFSKIPFRQFLNISHTETVRSDLYASRFVCPRYVVALRIVLQN